VISPVPKTTELGAVATGSINAQLALIAAGTIITSGDIPAAITAAANAGHNNVVLAVFDVVSVMKVTAVQIRTISKRTWTCRCIQP